jgi:CubicO group peptidase (beta-lactamase class C family)
MKRRRWLLLFIPLVALLALLPLWLSARQTDDLPRSTPAAEGISTQAVINMMDSLLMMPGCDIHHVMVVRHGKVVAEMHAAPFRAEDSHTLYSVSKLVTALAVGIAIDENRLRLDDRVLTFFFDKMPDVISPLMADMTVRDLLMMSSGITPDVTIRTRSTDWARDWLAQPCDEAPGTAFHYDSMCSFMLSAIVQRVTGRSLLEYLQEKLFTPMHINQAEWEKSPDGICTGGWGLRVQTEALAKLGVLILNKGEWDGQQLVSADYVEQACSPLISAESESSDGDSFSYGYHMWNTSWQGLGKLSMAMGKYGQTIAMLPDQDMVVVVLGVMVDDRGVLSFLKNQLLPGVIRGAAKGEKQLQQQLDSLCANAVIYLPQGEPKGKPVDRKRLEMMPNSSGLAWAMVNSDTLLLARDGQQVEAFPMGYREWHYGQLKGLPPYSIEAMNRMKDLNHDFVTASAYAWTSPAVLEVRTHYVNWIASSTYVFDFNKSELTFRDDFPGNQPYKIHFTVK